ncbi:MAG: N-acetylmuramoyl-L-alanine amidase [Bacteroidales bacterium]|nr:N-acetylmuramoyl-L-alanine amidase [Bacteroidales bacterium]
MEQIRRILSGCLMLFIAVTALHAQTLPDAGGIRTVVIDAGHGGTDPGALGTLYKEKDITLKIALQLGKQMKAEYPDLKIIYTRETDKNVTLYQRADIANKASADLFISIHCNSVAGRSASPSGAETLVMGTTKAAANLEVAKIENSVMLLEDDYEAHYEGFDPKSPESFILFSLYQNTFLNHSLDFAVAVQSELKKAGRVDRGVKQAGVYVLWKTAAPSVLIEVGFMTNPTEEKWMYSASGTNKIVQSILAAFKKYKSNVDSRSSWSVVEEKPASAAAGQTGAQSSASASAGQSATQTAATQPASGQPAAQPATTAAGQAAASRPASGIEFAVQVLSSTRAVPLNSRELKNYQGIAEVKVSANSYKYVAFRSPVYAEAAARLATVRKTFPDAFVTAFKNGVPMPLQEARREAGQ